MWIILALIATIEYCDAQGFYNEMACANCTGVNKECTVTTTGWSCDHNFDAKKLIDNGTSSGIPASLSQCMLPGMEFKTQQALYSYCCIWSPAIGCQKLKKSDGLEDHCYRCTRAMWSAAMDGTTCPCGKFFLHRKNSEIMLKPWNFYFATQAMLIIILNL